MTKRAYFASLDKPYRIAVAHALRCGHRPPTRDEWRESQRVIADADAAMPPADQWTEDDWAAWQSRHPAGVAAGQWE